MEPSPKFWDRIAARYATKPVADEAAYQKKLATTRDYLRPDMVLLEFGCGTGSTAIAHAPCVKHIRAIDVSSKMIAIAQAKANAANVTNVTFEQATIEGIDLPDQSFDAVLGHSILHLLHDRDAAIAKAFRILKPDGIFVSSTMCLADSMQWFRFIGPVGRLLGLIPLVRVFTREDLETSLTAAGFTIDHASQPGKDKAVFIVATR